MTCKICGKLNETWWYEYEGYNEEELRRNVVRSPACPCHHKTICPRCHYQHREECTKSCVRDPKILEGVTCSYWKYKTSDGYAHEMRAF